MRRVLALACLMLAPLASSMAPAQDDTRPVLTGVVTKVIDADTIDSAWMFGEP